jgi:hypothetical protein
MTDPLGKLFGSQTRIKLLRLFLFNPRLSFTAAQAAARARVTPAEARKEIDLFYKSGLLKRSRRGGAGRFILREDFLYREALQALLINAPARAEEIVSRLRGSGAVKFVVLSGVFVGEWERTLDILIVADRLAERKLKGKIRRLEAELGKELQYALLTSSDFLYRLNMNDKLLRDVFDYPHTIVLDKLNTGLK